ncbi:FecR family protein [Brevundimonas guildfordensis]|uniref:FecR domain-containing protein n=1 Tax=Brevundimonas guildfordensis TaxID=2762241 RepID=A0ABR8QWR7_9CAUL|nr:FecR domain-containing protein [Brevundimonas guildfordensis]MBD7939984.1 FecR domain-containing protein [Brevundimonas guildfordensis]
MRRSIDPRPTPAEEMVDRIVAADFGSGPLEERQALERLRREGPEQIALHDEIMALWGDLGQLEPPRLSSRQPTRGRQNWRLIAASVLLPILAATALFLAHDAFGDRGATLMSTGADERRIVTLADGSTVSLSPHTVVRAALGRDQRLLELEQGEALFDVAHDARRPFLVDVGSGQVRAIGTRFNIRKGEDVVVTVVEGVVRVTAGDQDGNAKLQLSQVASAGHQVHLGKRRDAGAAQAGGAYLSPARKVDAERYASWVNGMLQFEGEPLSQVIDELNRYSSHKIRLPDASMADIPIYGMLHIGDAEGLRALVEDLERGDRRRNRPASSAP